ncbi:MAG: molecular chaperone TorD family protein [Holophagales bacterium]|nr:molecular chaperone TorD family protein [Holophagales bacterium]
MISGGPGPRGLLLALAGAHPSGGGPRTAAFVSGFLSRVLLDPPSEALNALLGRRPDPPLAHDGLGARVEAVARLYREAEPVGLAKEWTRLFVGPRAAPCRPWHDTWECEGPPRLRGPKHASMLGYWSRAGLEPVHVETEPADHAGLVLALFSALATRAAGGDDVRRLLEDLWAAHVASWMPRFAATLESEARVPALKAAGELLVEAVS